MNASEYRKYFVAEDGSWAEPVYSFRISNLSDVERSLFKDQPDRLRYVHFWPGLDHPAAARSIGAGYDGSRWVGAGNRAIRGGAVKIIQEQWDALLGSGAIDVGAYLDAVSNWDYIGSEPSTALAMAPGDGVSAVSFASYRRGSCPEDYRKIFELRFSDSSSMRLFCFRVASETDAEHWVTQEVDQAVHSRQPLDDGTEVIFYWPERDHGSFRDDPDPGGQWSEDIYQFAAAELIPRNWECLASGTVIDIPYVFGRADDVTRSFSDMAHGVARSTEGIEWMHGVLADTDGFDRLRRTGDR